MLQYLLSSRLIQAGLVFFVLSVSGSLFYSWHVKRTTDKELAHHQRFLQGHSIQSETRPAVDTTEIRPVDFGETGTPSESDASQDADDTEPSDEVAEFMDMADAFLLNDVVLSEEPPEDVPVSPYGFGPYPEVPIDFPGQVSWEWSEEMLANMKENMEADTMRIRGISWTAYLKEIELMSRVSIKLWQETGRLSGVTSNDQTGLFYPSDPNVLYVKWRERTLPNGEVMRYMSRTSGSAYGSLSIAQIEGRESLPDWLEIRSFDEGIDPYEFLGLNR